MQNADIGIYGLGTMGSALALNLADNGFCVAVTNREPEWIAPFLDKAGPLADRLVPAETLESFVAALKPPRAILMMIPSGAPVDAMLTALRPLLEPGDLIIDGGNADFNETIRRSRELDGTGLDFVGIGVSGGAEGARHGPSMMVGGAPESWARLRPMLEAIAARFEGAPCVAHLGPDGAGHFVKTVHNGIEYADMQMMAETYGLLRDGAGLDAPRIGDIFAGWSRGPLRSFLIDVTAQALGATDPETGQPMVDVIRDAAGQKGTGRWTLIEALKLGQSPSTIEAAVGARSWSSDTERRAKGAALPAGAGPWPDLPPDTLGDALLAGRVLAHAQGFDVLAAASAEQGWSLDLARIAEIWRAGCIIRSDLLDGIAAAYRDTDGDLLHAPQMRAVLEPRIGALRQVVASAVAAGLPVPALAAGLGWYDTLRHPRGTANLIQAQRDVFGNHGFERTDKPGKHHGPWG